MTEGSVTYSVKFFSSTQKTNVKLIFYFFFRVLKHTLQKTKGTELLRVMNRQLCKS